MPLKTSTSLHYVMPMGNNLIVFTKAMNIIAAVSNSWENLYNWLIL